jgi:hypothetical protein
MLRGELWTPFAATFSEATSLSYPVKCRATRWLWRSGIKCYSDSRGSELFVLNLRHGAGFPTDDLLRTSRQYTWSARAIAIFNAAGLVVFLNQFVDALGCTAKVIRDLSSRCTSSRHPNYFISSSDCHIGLPAHIF